MHPKIIIVTRKRMWHPRGAPRAQHHYREEDGTPQACVSRAGRGLRHPEDASLEPGAGPGILGMHPEPIVSLGEGWSTLGVHLWGWEKDVTPQGCTQSSSSPQQKGWSTPGVYL